MKLAFASGMVFKNERLEYLMDIFRRNYPRAFFEKQKDDWFCWESEKFAQMLDRSPLAIISKE